MTIPLYDFKFWGELARAVGAAVIVYIGAAVAEKGLPTDRATWIALGVGAVPIIYGAIRTALNLTPITPTPPAP